MLFSRTDCFALRFFAVYYLNHPELDIEIAGHTDDSSSDAYNLKLSENRAAAVYNYLLTKGVVPKTITYRGYGSTQLVAANKNDNRRSKNHRIKLVILK